MHTRRMLLAVVSFAAVGCQVIGGFEDFSATGDAVEAGGAAGSSAPGGMGGSAPTECPPIPPGAADRFEAASHEDGSCFQIMKRSVDVASYYTNANEVPAAGGKGACSTVFTETFACLTASQPGCKVLPVTCVSNPEAAAYCAKQGNGVRLCSLEELQKQCGIKQSTLREWAGRCVDNDGGGKDCDTLGDLPEVSPKPPPFGCDTIAQTRSDDRRPDMGFRCCLGPGGPPPP